MYQEVIDFWFNRAGPKRWWKKDQQFDALIVREFADLHKRALACELFAWREQPLGRLAEIIVLDQFSRNMFRDSPGAFAADNMALALAQEAVRVIPFAAMDATQRGFLYMPFMHSESALIHQQALSLFRRNGVQSSLEFEMRHKDIIDRFGRYPHRNRILGRESTAEELEFLQQPGSGF